MLKSRQGYNFVTCLREFGVSSLKQFSPHLLGLVTNIVGNLIALQVHQKCFQPNVVGFIPDNQHCFRLR